MPMLTNLASTATSSVVSSTTFQSVMTALTEQISPTTVVGVLATVVGACVGLAFLWWGVRKAISALMSAFKKGRLSV